MKYNLLFFTTVLLVASIGCSDDINQNLSPPTPTPEDLVRVNSYAVQNAAEAFARENNGVYPSGLSDRSLAGRTLIDCLPERTFLENPITNVLDVPIELTATGLGETAYRPYLDENSVPIGYRITGFGADARIITLSNLPDSLFERDEKVIDNCFIVRDALETYALDNNGEFPYYTYETNTIGLTLIDYLPNGELLGNPYLDNLPLSPVMGQCSSPGLTGFITSRNDLGYRTGYFIEGCGRDMFPIIRIFKPAE